MTMNVDEYLHTLRLGKAVMTYLARQAQQVQPEGGYDEAGRWNPAANEIHRCCLAVRDPVRRYPDGMLRHCRTLKHVAQLYDVDEGELRRALNQYRKQHRESVK